MRLLVLLDHFLLLQALDCHNPARLLLPAQPHFPKGSSPDHPESLEVTLADLFPPFPQLLTLLVMDVLSCLLLLFDGEVELFDLLLEELPVEGALFLL
jgi:hypothetical protein